MFPTLYSSSVNQVKYHPVQYSTVQYSTVQFTLHSYNIKDIYFNNLRINRNKLKCYTHRIVTIYIFNKIANSFKCPYRSIFSKKLFQVSLSLMYEGMKMEKAFTVSIQPMEMYSFILSR